MSEFTFPPDPTFPPSNDDEVVKTVVGVWTATMIFFCVLALCFVTCILVSLGMVLYFLFKYGCPFGGDRSRRSRRSYNESSNKKKMSSKSRSKSRH